MVTMHSRPPEHKTGKCLPLISRMLNRTMLTDLGASVTMDGLGRFDEQIRAAGLLHVTGILREGPWPVDAGGHRHRESGTNPGEHD